MISLPSEDPSLRLAHRLLAISIVFVLLVQALVPHQVQAQSSESSRLLVEKRILLASAQERLDILENQESSYDTDISYEQDPRVVAIRAYFTSLDMPAADYAEDFIRSADEHGLGEDWALLAAISRWETTGCKYTLEHPASSRANNCFGYGPKGYSFDSIPEGIDYVTAVLAGKNEKMAYYYAGKTLDQKLYAYNSVNPGYAKRIKDSMSSIESLLTERSSLETA